MLESFDRSPALDGAMGSRRRSPAELLIRYLVGARTAGRLTVKVPGGAAFEIGGERSGVHADITLRNWRGLRRMIVDGDIGFADGYRYGDWGTSDLKSLILWTVENEPMLSSFSGMALSRAAYRIQHRLRANTRTNSKRNISAHYDLGNEFYAAWLDPEMNYSSGIYVRPDGSLEEAQAAKIDRVVDLLDVRSGDNVLEIGCGWGAVAERLIAVHGCRFTGVTLSEPQRSYARQRLQKHQGDRLASVRLQDYRDLSGTFDRIVSIEMLEAVGEKYWPLFFAKLRECLSPTGNAVLQVITIDPARYQAYRSRPDFIQAHIFPGGMLPTTAIIEAQAQQAGLSLRSVETFGLSYARTLAEWRTRFNSSWPSIATLGFDAPFRRLWNYYLAYCEAGFESGVLDVGLYKLERAA